MNRRRFLSGILPAAAAVVTAKTVTAKTIPTPDPLPSVPIPTEFYDRHLLTAVDIDKLKDSLPRAFAYTSSPGLMAPYGGSPMPIEVNQFSEWQTAKRELIEQVRREKMLSIASRAVVTLSPMCPNCGIMVYPEQAWLTDCLFHLVTCTNFTCQTQYLAKFSEVQK